MDLSVTRIIRGGIYFLQLPRDEKLRPYLVVSEDLGYGKNVLTFCISSKYTTSDIVIPVLLMGKISFIRTSSVIEVSPKIIAQAEFAGIVSNEIIEYTAKLFTERLLPTTEEERLQLRKRIEEYLDLLEKRTYPLYANTNVIFTKKGFLENTLVQHQKEETKKLNQYPFELSDWSMQSLQQFRTDQFRLPQAALMSKYKAPSKRVDFLKMAVKKEIEKRKRGVPEIGKLR